MLLGSTDPCAVSWYGAKFILTPIAVDPYHTDPDRPGSNYKNNLDAWTNCLRDSGFACTKDSLEISVYDRGVLSVTSSDDQVDQLVPQFYQLYQNYPNPFNPNTVIKYQIPELSFVTLKVYDVLGNEIVILVNDKKPAGEYEVEFSTGLINQTLPSGIYFYRLQAKKFVETKKMVVIK